ncbi:MAG: hypothetical protein AAGE52_14655 [Myxococcota bacterium]
MTDVLELLHEYRSLLTTGDEPARQAALGALLGTTPPWVKKPARIVSMPVQFTAAGRFGRGESRSLSATGIVVATRNPPALGTPLLLRLDDGRGTTYIFPALVAFRRGGRWGAIGAHFDGEPERTLTAESLAVWQGLRLSQRLDSQVA